MPHRILVAEDDVTSRLLLAKTLENKGYEVITASDGLEADGVLRKQNHPHLAILDWEMPGMTGLEVCRRLRERKNLDYTFVILLTANQKKDAISEAYASGVDDFLSKPFTASLLTQRLTVAARMIDNGKLLQAKQKELAEVIQNLEAMAEDRAKQLVHTERLATLGTLSAGIAHEINNPCTFISGNLNILHECWPLVDQALEQFANTPEADAPKVEFIREETPKILNGAQSGVVRIQKIVDGLKKYSRKGTGDREPFDLNQSLYSAFNICENALKYQVTIKTNYSPDQIMVLGDSQEMEQVFINIITNAADAISEIGPGTLTASSGIDDQIAWVTIEDTGPGFPDKILKEIWKPFFTTKGPGKGTGLGMPIVQRIVENHSGKIHAENLPEGGARIKVTLPIIQKIGIGQKNNYPQISKAEEVLK